MKRQCLLVAGIFGIWCVTGLMTVCEARENNQAEPVQTEAAQTESVQNSIKVYEGEITDEMIESFLKADAKIRILRQQITQITEKILTEENVKPEVYMAIAQKMRQDQEFLEKIRTIAASMVAAESTSEENQESA